jgi:hypothetical protein
MDPVRLPWMSDSEIKDLVGRQVICRIAINGDDYPYLAPFRYVRIGDTLYFHFTDYGKKMRLLQEKRGVCVQVEHYTPDLSCYRFVSFRGELEQVSDPVEYEIAVKEFRETGRGGLSTKFLAAHGFSPEAGWGSFDVSRRPLIVKLVNVAERVGLRSP